MTYHELQDKMIFAISAGVSGGFNVVRVKDSGVLIGERSKFKEEENRIIFQVVLLTPKAMRVRGKIFLQN